MAEDIDPLDAYMLDIQKEIRIYEDKDKIKSQNGFHYTASELVDHPPKGAMLDLDEEEEEVDNNENKPDQIKEIPNLESANPEDILALALKRAKKKDLVSVDHASVYYEPFRKDFYIETNDINKMTDEEVKKYRIELNGIKIRGVSCPKPIKKWTQIGLSSRVLEIIKKLNYERPTPIQAQSIPAIMSGRDVIGVAKTGSGKTIAYLLPLFRHIADQRPLSTMEGPIALIMAPTRELAVQVVTECKKFTKALGFRAICAYGGSAIKDQIADLKRGAEIIVCTPGRMIDLLCSNSGKVTNLKRVTYVVLDEADRMFDLGFGPQVMKIMNNIRPDRQTVLFSATFPKQMEALARKILIQPLEIAVGGKSVVCDDVTQIIEIVDEEKKFAKLLEILGQWYEEKSDERVLIFVERQDAADNLFKDLIKRGYICTSIHGGKDQADRDSSLSDFKDGYIPILIATSVAARGLDVKELNLVINYECPNHMEDYVHRVGRTGRAGHKGIAVTFITPDQEKYAPDLVKALKSSNTEVSPQLLKMSEEFTEKVKAGQAQFTGSGFGGKGLERIDKEREKAITAQKATFGELDEEDEAISEERKEALLTGQPAPKKPAPNKPLTPVLSTLTEIASRIQARLGESNELKPVVDKISEINARFNQGGLSGVSGETVPVLEDGRIKGYKCELEINDYTQYARFRATHRDVLSQIQDNTGVSITTRGSYFMPHATVPSGQRRLHLLIEGDSELNMNRAKREIMEVILEATQESVAKESSRYSVI